MRAVMLLFTSSSDSFLAFLRFFVFFAFMPGTVNLPRNPLACAFFLFSGWMTSPVARALTRYRLIFLSYSLMSTGQLREMVSLMDPRVEPFLWDENNNVILSFYTDNWRKPALWVVLERLDALDDHDLDRGELFFGGPGLDG